MVLMIAKGSASRTKVNKHKLVTQAKAVLAKNDMGIWTKPTSVELYIHQWLWDSFFIGIGLRHYNLERAKDEVWSPFRGQWHNGMVPHIIFGPAKGYHAGPERWRCREVASDAPRHIQTSGVSQPPVAAEAVVRVGEMMSQTERREWYREMYPLVAKWHQWWYRERDPDGDGLVSVVLSWETGLDDSPPWMTIMQAQSASLSVKVMRRLGGMRLAEKLRRDTAAVPAEERISTVNLLTVYGLVRNLRRLHYDHKLVMAQHPLQIDDLNVNCILMRNNELLAQMAEEIGETLPPEVARAREQAPAALESLWDEELGQYFSRDALTGKLVRVPSITTFMPLYAQVLPEGRVQRLLTHLHNPKTFGAPYPIPSAPQNSAYYNEHRYWQGPSWVNMNWLIMEGLRRNNQAEEAERLGRDTVEMIIRGGMYEYFSPTDASPAGAGDFSWTAALLIDLLEQGFGAG